MKADTFIKAMGNIDERFLNVEVPERKIHRKWTKWVAGAAAAVLLIACPLPAMTAFGSDEAYNVLYSISPRIAQDFKPVQKSCTDDGIEMTVVSAKRKGSRAEVYLTMRDTTGECPYGDWDLYDSYRLNLWRDMSGCCKFDEYDEETHTAHFIIVLNTMDGSPMPKGKITFSVSELLLGKKETKGDIDADLSAIPTAPETMHRDDISGYSSYSGEEPVISASLCRMMSPYADLRITSLWTRLATWTVSFTSSCGMRTTPTRTATALSASWTGTAARWSARRRSRTSPTGLTLSTRICAMST